MYREQIIEKIKNNISLYKTFTCPDYPELGVYTRLYKDILVKLFNHSQNPYSVIYSDVNKLSVINEKFGKNTGDKVLHTLLEILTTSSSLPKDSSTIRIGGDEFITFVPNMNKQEVQEALKNIQVEIENRHDELYCSGFTFGVEDFTSGNAEQLIDLAEQQVANQKNRKKDSCITKNCISKSFVELPIPNDVSDEQKEKWKTLNTKINIAVDNHLRDIRPSSNTFQYLPQHIQTDFRSFLAFFFSNKTNSEKKNLDLHFEDKKPLNISYDNIKIIFSLFEGNDIDFSTFDDKKLEDINSSLNTLCKTLITNEHSGLFSKSYYRLYLADKLLDAKQKYQAVYFSMAGIRPSNTAYGHAVTDKKIEKTVPIIVDAFKSKREFNNKPFSFDKNDTFFTDQGGGNYLAFIPKNKSLSLEEIQEMESFINSQATNDICSTFKVACAVQNDVNKKSIPFFVNSTEYTSNGPIEWLRTLRQIFINRTPLLNSSNIYIEKPFVQFARKLKSVCNNNKDRLKSQNLSTDLNQQCVYIISHDFMDYYQKNIEGAETTKCMKVLLENVMTALLDHEDYANKLNQELLQKKLDERKFFGSNNIKKTYNLDGRE